MKYIADRLKTSTFLVLCLTIVMVTLASCSDNNAEDPDLKRFKNRFSGDYQYSSAIWTGGNIDLDGDGTGHKNLDEEFRGHLELVPRFLFTQPMSQMGRLFQKG